MCVAGRRLGGAAARSTAGWLGGDPLLGAVLAHGSLEPTIPYPSCHTSCTQLWHPVGEPRSGAVLLGQGQSLCRRADAAPQCHGHLKQLCTKLLLVLLIHFDAMPVWLQSTAAERAVIKYIKCSCSQLKSWLQSAVAAVLQQCRPSPTMPLGSPPLLLLPHRQLHSMEEAESVCYAKE